ncbi:MAG: TrkA family potassium uptake protein [Chloroflexi bacterium]|nr:TrkA family potassium uptake protein [Chloroflexota bacterium]MCL5275715.1 TrkA family potassium uptake protein [Chloroflexota bacterium]
MLVIIVGGGRTGSELARLLLSQGHQVKVIDDRPVMIERLNRELGEDKVVMGDGSSPSALEAAGIAHANVLAAVTAEDEANLVATTLGRFEFNVPRTIARVNNPDNAWMFTPEMGVDVALNQAEILAKLVAEEMSLGDMMTLLKLRKGQFSLVEEKVHPTALSAGKTLSALDLPKQCNIIAVIRKGELLIPRGELMLEASDEVLAIAHASQVAELAALMNARR